MQTYVPPSWYLMFASLAESRSAVRRTSQTGSEKGMCPTIPSSKNVDERSRVLYLVAEVSDPYNQQSSNWQEPLRVGTFVDARIEGETLLNVVRLPRSVLQKDNTVWTVDSERTLHPVKVEIVQSDETSVLVSADVIAGKLICKTLLDNPLPGTPVQFSTPVPMNAGIDYVSD